MSHSSLSAGLSLLAAFSVSAYAQSATPQGPTAEPGVASVRFVERNDALSMPSCFGEYSFEIDGTLVELVDGTSRLTGSVVSNQSPMVRFAVDVSLSRESAGWRAVAGQLIGFGAAEGGVLDIASGQTFDMGAAQPECRVTLVATSAPLSSIPFPSTPFPAKFVLDLQSDRTPRVGRAEGIPAIGGVHGGHALLLGYLGGFVFETSGILVERSDGTAILTGSVVKELAPSQAFKMTVVFSDRSSTGAPDYPPQGSPKKEFYHPLYSENGGPIDTNSWHYYQSISGVLIGTGDYSTGLMVFERTGSAFQIGVGANGKNLNMGGSGWFTITHSVEPPHGWVQDPSYGGFGGGDLNVDFFSDLLVAPVTQGPGGSIDGSRVKHSSHASEN